MAKGWKGVVERTLVRTGLVRFVERRRGPAVVVLAYHNIVPVGEKPAGDVSLHLDQRAFADQLDWLLEGRRVVALEEAFVRSEGDEETRVVLTFDDAYQGMMTAGVEELSKRDLPATVFVPPALLGSTGFWWDLLAPPGEPLDPRVRAHALTELSGRTEAILAWAEAEGLAMQDLPRHTKPVVEAAMDPAQANGKLRLGAHSWSHPNLARLSHEEAFEELRASRDWLAERTDGFTNWLAYPYGLVGDGAQRAAEMIFDGALLVSGGPSERGGRRVGFPYRVPRINVPRGLTIEGLAMRIAGLLADH
jgi:peptidoglycan/xylan/chitin deacetylase (PgdA/CDA1 family)